MALPAAGMIEARKRYRRTLAAEAVIGAIISIVIGCTMFGIMFGGQSRIPIWGGAGLVFDAMPSTFIPVLLMGFGITLIVRRRRSSGRFDSAIAAIDAPVWVRRLPANLLARAMVVAVPATGAMVALAAAIAPNWPAASASFGVALALKVIQNIVIGALFAPLIVARALAEHAPAADVRA